MITILCIHFTLNRKPSGTFFKFSYPVNFVVHNLDHHDNFCGLLFSIEFAKILTVNHLFLGKLMSLEINRIPGRNGTDPDAAPNIELTQSGCFQNISQTYTPI